jgi:catechol 2,3-dioxygenase-like lactoylglutathione lyase family enzyme
MKSTRDVIIQTPNLVAATEFYQTVMGLTLSHQTPALVAFETGSIQLYIEPGPTPGPVFEFLTDDLPAAREKLLAAGCIVVDENPTIPRCYLRDPYGLTFNLAQGS